MVHLNIHNSFMFIGITPGYRFETCVESFWLLIINNFCIFLIKWRTVYYRLKLANKLYNLTVQLCICMLSHIYIFHVLHGISRLRQRRMKK